MIIDYDDETWTAPDPCCEMDGENIDTYGGEHYWSCRSRGQPRPCLWS